jgi:hypothetical protein
VIYSLFIKVIGYILPLFISSKPSYFFEVTPKAFSKSFVPQIKLYKLMVVLSGRVSFLFAFCHKNSSAQPPPSPHHQTTPQVSLDLYTVYRVIAQ